MLGLTLKSLGIVSGAANQKNFAGAMMPVISFWRATALLLLFGRNYE